MTPASLFAATCRSAVHEYRIESDDSENTLRIGLMCSSRCALGYNLRGSRDGAVDGGAVHVVVRDHANCVLGCGAAKNISGTQVVADFGGGSACAVHVEYDDIGCDALGIDRDAADLCKTVRQMLRVFMI